LSDCWAHSILKITPDKKVTTLAGSTSGYKNGIGKNAMFNHPLGIHLHNDYIYVCDWINNAIRTVNTYTGEVSTFYIEPLLQPHSISVDSAGYIFVSSWSGVLFKLSPEGTLCYKFDLKVTVQDILVDRYSGDLLVSYKTGIIKLLNVAHKSDDKLFVDFASIIKRSILNTDSVNKYTISKSAFVLHTEFISARCNTLRDLH